MQIYLASGNIGKAKEFSTLMDSNTFSVISSQEVIDVDEKGLTYEENAFLKAKAYYDLLKRPVFSDDSGLNVLSLPKELGIYSARFGGEHTDFKQKIELLLEKMSDFSGHERKAYFCCVLCFYLSQDEIYFFEGKMEGYISYESKGCDGFGYDPIFIPKFFYEDKKTLAQLAQWKENNSHRSVAAKKANEFFKGR